MSLPSLGSSKTWGLSLLVAELQGPFLLINQNHNHMENTYPNTGSILWMSDDEFYDWLDNEANKIFED